MPDIFGPVAGAAVGLGLLHGLEPGHGWPLAASYGLARPNRYAAGLAASVLLGIGHLISSIAVVLAFFGLKEWLALGTTSWIGYAAGALLIALGLWELRPGHGHGHSHTHHHAHGHARDPDAASAPDRGLWGIAGAAFALGFVHEEEFEIIGLCAGSDACLALMLLYALAVLAAIIGPTLGLIAGFQRFGHRLEHWAPYLPKVSGAVLILMGAGFAAGLL